MSLTSLYKKSFREMGVNALSLWNFVKILLFTGMKLLILPELSWDGFARGVDWVNATIAQKVNRMIFEFMLLRFLVLL